MSDINGSGGLSWEYEDPYESSGLLANLLEEFRNDENISLLCGNLDHVANGDLFSGAAQINGGDFHSGDVSNGKVKLERVAEYYTDGSYSLLQDLREPDSSKELSKIWDETDLLKTGLVGCNGVQQFEGTSLVDLPTLPSVPEGFTQPQNGVYSRSSIVEADRMLQGFDAQQPDMENNIGVRSVGTNNVVQRENLSASNIAKTMGIPTDGCNGTGKPRARARRGQATDPHSIAERLRREKITERMRNLQELVPDSTKTDKASMLDEIIEYVKFLQLQVKVLSMSRVGATQGIVPPFTDNQSMEPNGLFPSAQSGFPELTIPPSAGQIAFEEEILKLMDSNMVEAMHHLQKKGLCVMPMALAAAISKSKPSAAASASASAADESQRFGSVAYNNGGSSSSSNTGFSPL